MLDDASSPPFGTQGEVSPATVAAASQGRAWTSAAGLGTLGWLLCAAILATFGVASTFDGGPGSTAPQWSGFVVTLVGSFLYQTAAPQVSRLRRQRAVVLWFAWTAVCLVAMIAPGRAGLRAPWTALDFALQEAGLLLGIACAWLCKPALAAGVESALSRLERPIMRLVVAVSIAAIFIPFAPDSPLVAPTVRHIDALTSYIRGIPAQLYLALKALILWMPLGLLYGFAERQTIIRRWAVAAVLTFVVVGLPLLHHALHVVDGIEILSGYWGIMAGTWLGVHTLRTASDWTPEPARDMGGQWSIESEQSRPTHAGLWRLARRAVAILILLATALWAWTFPRWGVPLLCGLIGYALLLGKYRHAWLFIVPATLPLLDLAPDTGRFFFDEFDMVLLTTVAMLLWHGTSPAPRLTFARPLTILLMLFGLSVVVSMMIGLLPLAPLDGNAFTNYFSHYNSVRVAKGFLWAAALMMAMRWTLPAGRDLALRLFLPGMWLGLAGVIVAGLWERASFASLIDLTIPYRLTATFSGMHTGGSDIETYLVLAIPLAWLALGRQWPAAVRLGGIALLALGAWLMTFTIARGGILALAVALAVLLASASRTGLRDAGNRRRARTAVIGLIAAGTVLAVGMGGGYLQKRLERSEEDFAERVRHWELALSIRDPGIATSAFGMGLGRFPEAYLFRSGTESLPSTYAFVDEGANRFLRLGGGETLYMAQRVPVSSDRRYSLSLRARSRDPDARLGVPLCEKHLLDSLRCQWNVIPVPGDGVWHPQTLIIDSGLVGTGSRFWRRAVVLSLYNDSDRAVVDVDDVEFQDETGRSLLRNGDFSAGGDDWFSATHSHLSWHTKNLWVGLLFEQGWFGILTFGLLLVAVVARLVPAVWRGDRVAGALLASLCGFLTVGMFGSLFDAPRIATLFFLLMALSGVIVHRSDNA